MVKLESAGAGGGKCGVRLSPATVAAAIWCSVTAAMILAAALVYRLSGPLGLKAIVQEGPISDLMLTLYATGAAWLVFGSVLLLLAFRRINAENAVSAACFIAVSLIYIGFIRERVRYGDVVDYIDAARSLAQGEHLPVRYLYPPLWATLLKPFVRLETRSVFDLLWCLNMLSLFALYFLLLAVLRRYGFAPRLAALVTAGFMIVNVPIVRTLGYVQINFHVLNLICASLLLMRRSAALSALALALAVHLKAAPALLVVAFAVARNWRWMIWFALFATAITVWTIAENGIYPYRDFIARAGGVLWNAGEPSFRQFSIDSFVRAIFALAGSGYLNFAYVVAPIKIVAAGLGFLAVRGHVARRVFARTEGAEGAVLNAVPGLLALMIMLQPIAWPHHCIFLGIPFLLLLTRIETSAEWTVLGAAYFLVFLMPVHDFFPWSYGRLAAVVVWFWLARSVSRRAGEGRFFVRARAALGTPVHTGAA
jgi:hypothetical protein